MSISKSFIGAAAISLLVAPASAQVHIMGRSDKTDIIFTVNQPNGEFLTRHKADLKGGKWNWLVTNSECPGAGSVWYASNGSTRQYFVVLGQATERDASVKAAEMARAYAKRQGPDWHAGIMRVLYNSNKAVVNKPATGALNKVKQGIRDLQNDCGSGRIMNSGVRG
jgi:stage V sporulation protein SpoVS